jgi:hypothetical protein
VHEVWAHTPGEVVEHGLDGDTEEVAEGLVDGRVDEARLVDAGADAAEDEDGLVDLGVEVAGDEVVVADGDTAEDEAWLECRKVSVEGRLLDGEQVGRVGTAVDGGLGGVELVVDLGLEEDLVVLERAVVP